MFSEKIISKADQIFFMILNNFESQKTLKMLNFFSKSFLHEDLDGQW